MNNLEEWKEATGALEEVRKDWGPHFELLRTEDGREEPIMMLFITKDTTTEWNLYNAAPEEAREDTADYIGDAKEELLEKVGFEEEDFFGKPLDDTTADKMTEQLVEKIKEYEARDGRDIKRLFINMALYSEWVALPAIVLEARYEEEVGEIGEAEAQQDTGEELA